MRVATRQAYCTPHHQHRNKAAPLRQPRQPIAASSDKSKTNDAMERMPYSVMESKMMFFRPCTAEDVPQVAEIEANSYPPDEAASPEALTYRQANAGDYFVVGVMSGAGIDGGDEMVSYACGRASRNHNITSPLSSPLKIPRKLRSILDGVRSGVRVVPGARHADDGGYADARVHVHARAGGHHAVHPLRGGRGRAPTAGG